MRTECFSLAAIVWLAPKALAPRPGLEPGTYGLTEIRARRKPI